MVIGEVWDPHVAECLERVRFWIGYGSGWVFLALGIVVFWYLYRLDRQRR